MKSVLVIFGKDLPKKSKKWLKRFDEILGPKELERLVGQGSIQEADSLVEKLSYLTLADGRRLSKSAVYQGYELWWLHYNDLMYSFCLPYTQYRNLLLYLTNFDKAYLHQAPHSFLFQYFLRAHNRQCVNVRQFRWKNLLPFSLGIFIQGILSFCFLFFLKIRNPQLMVWTADRFDGPHDYDFRLKIIYEELRKRKIIFAEFIRSLEPWSGVLRHAWKRKRPVFYSTAIIEIVHALARKFGRFSVSFSASDPEERFWFLVAAHYLGDLKGTIWSIQAMKFVLQWLGVKAAIIIAGCNRTFHEVLGCKLAGIKTVGIQHAAMPRCGFIADFMPGFDNKVSLSLDRYGLWSEWWRDYYLKYSRVYKPEQLYVSGPLEPLVKEAGPAQGDPAPAKRGPLKVLFVSEQLAAPSEVMPYLLKLLRTEDFIVSIKFRPYRDGFEIWLKEHHPDILEKIRVFRGSPQQAAALSDVVVGSHSTAVLEALLQSKPIVFFWTDKWGDYFGIKDFDEEGRLFASNPDELADFIRKSHSTPEHTLRQLRERFFGNPDKNGSRWVVEQALEFAKNYGR